MNKYGMLPYLLMLILFLMIPNTKGNISEYRGNNVHDESETIIFFIQDDPDHEISAYIYDSERNHLLGYTSNPPRRIMSPTSYFPSFSLVFI